MLHALVVAAAVLSGSVHPTCPAPPELRLTDGVRPVRQSVELTLDPDAEPHAGRVEIELDVAPETPLVWLNATGLAVTSATLGPGRAVMRVSVTGTISRKGSDGIFARREAQQSSVDAFLDSGGGTASAGR